jgi:hypothetical protein
MKYPYLEISTFDGFLHAFCSIYYNDISVNEDSMDISQMARKKIHFEGIGLID